MALKSGYGDCLNSKNKTVGCYVIFYTINTI